MPDVFFGDEKNDAPRITPAPAAKSQPALDKPVEKLVEHEERNRAPSMVATFCKNPANIDLVGQEHDERVLLFLRQDFATNTAWIFNTIFFALIPFVFPAILQLGNISIDFLPDRVIFLIIAFYYLLLIGYGLANFVTWFYTIGIITNKKAMDIDFQNLSSINVATVNLIDTNDAKYTQTGFFQSFFDYGTVTITVEATKEQLVFERTPRPAMVANFLGELIGENRK